MLNNKTKNRLTIFVAISILTIIAIVFIFKTLEDNVLYFYSPSDIDENNEIILSSNIRIGGMVKKNSINEKGDKYEFVLTDFNQEISVTYSGILPNLFVEGQGAVVEGKLVSRKYFIGTKILAKHDENYMPPELKNVKKK